MKIARRRFLVDAVCASGGLLASGPLVRSALADEKCLKNSPAWVATCRDVIARPTGFDNCWTALKAVGVEGVEVDVAGNLTLPGLFHPTTKYTLATPSGVDRFAADAAAGGQKVTAFCLHNQFETQADFEVDCCTRLAGVAKTLGVPVIRLDVVPVKLARAEFLKLAVATLARIIKTTESTGTLFGIENHGNTTNDPAFLNPLFAGVGSERLGLTLDTGNFYWYGHPLSKVYEWVEAFAPRVFHTHCKNIRYPEEEREKQRPMGWKYADYGCPIDEGDIDYARVAAILKKAGYHNDYCIENEFLGNAPGPKAAATLAREIQFLKQIRTNLYTN
jgi:sugar phosphate isomerase/epimerase